MKTCLFVTEDWPLTPDAYGGAGPLCYSHLELLAHAGWQIWLLILFEQGTSKGFQQFTREQPETWQRIKAWCRHETMIPIRRKQVQSNLWQRARLALQEPARLFIAPAPSMVDDMLKQAECAQSDLIWAEHLLPGTLAAHIFAPNLVVYSHHDWYWRIKSHGQGRDGGRYKFKMWLRRRHEEALVRRMKACVSASATEAIEVAQISGKKVGYFPTTYPVYGLSSQKLPSPPRIVHLGGMRTTANRIGLQRFLEICWPRIKQACSLPPELWIVGSLSGISDDLCLRLEEAGAVCTGFVEDLNSLLRAYDIHIVPWEHNTGTRTRIPLALNHGQALVSTRAAAACLPEIRHEENALLSDSLEQMTEHILLLLSNNERRQQLAAAGRQTFQRNFTRAALQPRFNQFLESICESAD